MLAKFMPYSSELMLAVWREACRCTRIAESAAKLEDLLSSGLPIERLVIRQIDKTLSHLETMTGALSVAGKAQDAALTEWAPEDIRRLVRWCRQDQVVVRHSAADRQHIALAAIPDALAGDVRVAPLISEHGTMGLLLLQLQSGARMNESQEQLCRALSEPLAVALENEHRLRELKALREAAEADKRSLLSRLGRSELTATVVGATGGLQPVMERVDLVAHSDAAVLILGETGSGKEVIARAIHDNSQRAEKPFIRVNCGAIPPDLVDSELFGHEKGSFTGASATRKGWFERADEGTLFLDEVGELPPAAQVRLLRVLQDGLFERVGGERALHVDVRIVVATHRDLAMLVQQGAFREDLWYRIAVFPIVLPPLRERSEDIPALAEHFASRAARRFGLKRQTVTSDALTLLATYPWPGNVRELGSVIDRAAILGNGERLDVARALGVNRDVVATKPSESLAWNTPAYAAADTPADSASVAPLDTAIDKHIRVALAATKGRIEGAQGAAALLQINPHTLRARMRKLGIDWARYRS